jgi:hypothetical protein
MVKSVAVVLVKEERRPKEVLIAVSPPIFLQRRPVASLFLSFQYPPLSVAK